MSEPRRSPLDAEHRRLDARMTPFGGWDMPLQYGGVLEEHRACRQAAVVFDVSHLGSVRVRGRGAAAGLQALLTNDLTRIEPGRAQYTHLLDAADGHVVDDIIVWWLAGAGGGDGADGDDDFLVIPNAANTAPAVRALQEAVPDGEVRDVTGERALLAVQGPGATSVLADVLPEAADLGRFRVAPLDDGVIAGGTGYTGEQGVELHVPASAAPEIWRALVDAGALPAGLGARDTLRLEMGYPLHGHELGPGITPLQARLEWVVSWEKETFRGREALERERKAGVSRVLRGLVADGRRIPRGGCVVNVTQGPGVVTSGNFSPTLGRGIALAFVPPDVEVPAPGHVEIRDKKVDVTVVDPPFVDAGLSAG